MMKAKRIFLPVVFASTLLLSACSVKIANMTPSTLPTNPSGIYTLSAKAEPQSKAIDPGSLAAYVIVDGEEHPMQPSELGHHYFDYDYRIPADRNSARFYYRVDYRLKAPGEARGELKEATSPLHELRLTDRYSITLEAERAPVGTRLAVLGRGFGRRDTVFVGGQAANTRFVSENSLEFTVPNLTPGQAYPVEIRGGARAESAGLLRIDPGTATPLSVIPSSLDLRTGERQALAFALDAPAPDGGLYLNVTTDVPNSVVMPEVIIPAGARTVNVTVEGGEPGTGTLFINADGFQELEIPVSVR